jgi:hypothetical protein
VSNLKGENIPLIDFSASFYFQRMTQDYTKFDFKPSVRKKKEAHLKMFHAQQARDIIPIEI